MTSLETVQSILNHVFSGTLNEALPQIAPTASFISTRPVGSARVPLYGTFVGPKGAVDFFETFARVLEPGEFVITASFEQAEHVAMYGHLRHKSRSTGRDFASDWALICRVKEGQLNLYHFYEDTASLELAIA